MIVTKEFGDMKPKTYFFIGRVLDQEEVVFCLINQIENNYNIVIIIKLLKWKLYKVILSMVKGIMGIKLTENIKH